MTQKQILDSIQKELENKVKITKTNIVMSLETHGKIDESLVKLFNEYSDQLKTFKELRDPSYLNIRYEEPEKRWVVSDQLKRSIIGKLSQIKQVTHDDFSYYPVNISAIARYITDLLEEYMNRPKIVEDR